MIRHLHIVSQPSGSIYEISKDLINGFKKMEEFVVTQEIPFEKIEIPEKRDILLWHFIDKDINRKEEVFSSFKKKVLIQPIDGTILKKEVVDLINKFDLIITPASPGKSIMQANGVYKPIVVIPNFYKKDIFTANSFKKIDNHVKMNDFVFYHESTCHQRKGIEILLEAYVKEFSDTSYQQNTVLILKDSEPNQYTFEDVEKIKEKIIKLQSNYKKPARILKISQNLSFEDLRDLWHRMDCYVSFARMEGFGIPLLRAIALEKQIVTIESNVSGYMDFLKNTKTNFVKNPSLVPALEEKMWLYDEGTEWEVISVKEARSVLKNVRAGFTFINKLHNISDYEFTNIIHKYAEELIK